MDEEEWVGLIANALLSAFFAGLVATLVTIAIEKLGGVLGGILGSTPTTVIPASIGLAIQAASYHGVTQAMFAVPIGMLGSSGFLFLWRIMPPYLPKEWSLYIRLMIMMAASLTLWGCVATLLWFLIHSLAGGDWEVPVVAVGLIALGINLVGGIIICFEPIPAPKGKKSVTLGVYFARALFAATAIGVSVFISEWNEVVAGIASTFPAIFLTSMVSLWLSQGEAVPAGATGPMMLGCSAVGAYACTFGSIYPAIDPHLDKVVSLGLSAFLCWLIAVVGVSVPSFFFVSWRQTKLPEEIGEEPPSEETPLMSSAPASANYR